MDGVDFRFIDVYHNEIRGQRYDIGVPISYANTVATFVGHIQC
jgi:hypothetical protein